MILENAVADHRLCVQKYHGISQTPTALVYKDGKEIRKVEGMGKF
jgi:hypothetical protein